MADQQELARDLGFLEAYTMGVGTMIGAGIFVLPSIVAANAGPASMVSFLIGGVVSLLTALSLSELATGMPKAGGSYYYVNKAMGSFFGSIVGWGMWAGLMFATAFYMLGFGQYLTYFYGNMPVALSALVMAALLVGINYRGVKEASSLQNLIVIALMGLIVVFVAFGVFNVDWQVFRPFNPHGWGAVASTAATVYVAFIGFEVIASSAEEIKDPGRNLPLSMIASVLTPTLFYVLVMLVATGVLPVDQLAASYIPVADVAEQYLGTIGAVMMVIGAILATVSSANASILSAARVNFAMGRDKILSSWLNEVHDNFRTPYRAILVTGGVILVLIGVGVGVETLADVASFAYLVTYALVHVAVIVMRRAAPADYDPDFRLEGVLYPTVPLVGFVACIVIVAQMRPVVMLVGGGIIVLGIVWYYAYAASRAVEVSMVGEAIMAEGVVQDSPAGRYRVVVPVANPKTEGHLLRLAAATASTHGEAELIAVNVIEVPQQTALAQELEFEEERIRKQQELLDSARGIAEELGIGLRTHAIIGRNAGDAILNVVEEENAHHVLLGWAGKRKRYQHILGSNIDKVVKGATCAVTLVKIGEEYAGDVVALVGEGSNAPLAAERAHQFVENIDGHSLTLLNVQEPGGDGEGEAVENGKAIIAAAAGQVGINRNEYDDKVIVSEDVEEAIMREVDAYDTVCVGATRSTALTQALFGSIPEKIGEQAHGTVAIARGIQHRRRTVAEAIVERLSG